MSTRSISLSTLVVRESLALGRFVVDIENPTEDFHDSKLLTANVGEYNTTIRPSNSSKDSLNFIRGKHISLSRSLENIDKLYRRRYRLENPIIVLENICGDKNTRAWLEDTMGTELEIYMVVGLETVDVPLKDKTLELVYMAQYRRLDFSWFSIREMEITVLQKNQWLPKRTIRVDDMEDPEDAVSVTLASTPSQDDEDSGASNEGYDFQPVSSTIL
ncbi:hypothetical protein TWF481_010460 [Arthrobotrys musiformis]|uniref:Uncharacterized protein n=1 Tax=Arthrobotrys musiformis TaxID=47236 RepID=A0AAV9W0T1_9PEZI